MPFRSGESIAVLSPAICGRSKGAKTAKDRPKMRIYWLNDVK